MRGNTWYSSLKPIATWKNSRDCWCHCCIFCHVWYLFGFFSYGHGFRHVWHHGCIWRITLLLFLHLTAEDSLKCKIDGFFKIKKMCNQKKFIHQFKIYLTHVLKDSSECFICFLSLWCIHILNSQADLMSSIHFEDSFNAASLILSLDLKASRNLNWGEISIFVVLIILVENLSQLK